MVMVQAKRVPRRSNGADPTSLLDLGELAPTRYITVHKKRYPMTNMDAQGLLDRAAIDALRQRVSDLEAAAQSGAGSADDIAEYEVRVRELAAKILPTCPVTELDRVPIGQLVALGAYFFVLIGVTSPLPRGLLAIPSMMGRSSPDSPTTTAAGNGSSSPPSRS